MLLPLVLLFVSILLLLFHCLVWKRSGLPPGPVPLPLFGNLLSIALDPPGYGPFQRWAKQFGPIYTVWFGEDAHVVLADFGLLKETAGDAFAGRHFSTKLFPLFGVTGGGIHGITRTEGEEWRELRRFSMKSMRNLGMCRGRMEMKILDHLEEMFTQIRAKMDPKGVAQSFHLEPLLDLMSGSVISELMFGSDFRRERAGQFHELKRLMNRIQAIQGSTRGQLLDSMPSLRHIPLFGHTFGQMDYAMAQLYAFFDKQIGAKLEEERRNGGGKPGEEGEQDFVLEFLEEMKKPKEGKAKNYFTMDSLRALCFDIFVAGQETSTNTLSFLVLYLLLDQHSQQKLHEELDQLEMPVGEAMLGMGHRARLPFLSAVINETQRLCNLLPINLSHRTTCATQIGKFQLPKGTPILPQIGNVLADERLFPDADKFRPERFLDNECRPRKCEELVPFGIGKRQCAGESLARMELFLFAANFFHHFLVLPVDPLNPPSTEKNTLLTVTPREYYCRIVDRRVIGELFGLEKMKDFLEYPA